jgi:biopolymer transport protein ExbB
MPSAYPPWKGFWTSNERAVLYGFTKARQPIGDQMSVYSELLDKGGPVTIVTLLLGGLAFVLIFDRLLYLHRARIDVSEFLRGLCNVLRRGNLEEAVAICDDTPGPVAQVVRAAVLRCGGGRHNMERAIRETSFTEIPRMERNLPLLATLAHLSLLLGLLGTVIGMILLFKNFEGVGAYVETKQLASGLWVALISTATGLSVAIPIFGFYNFLVGRVEQLVLDMDKAGMEIMHFLEEEGERLHARSVGAVSGTKPAEAAAESEAAGESES